MPKATSGHALLRLPTKNDSLSAPSDVRHATAYNRAKYKSTQVKSTHGFKSSPAKAQPSETEHSAALHALAG